MFRVLEDLAKDEMGSGQEVRIQLTIDPLALRVLSLQTAMFTGLQEVGSKHAVLVRSNTLASSRSIVRIFHYLQLVLLIFTIEEVVKSCWREAQTLCYQASEEGADIAHLLHI